jgi:tetratricopeptide (TPR) repeat protein
MSKENKLQLLSPLFLKYQADFEKNPRSRVFAPLAEIYRKLGMSDKAMEILSQGIRFHPTYVMGYLGLAFCYFDLRQFTLAYTTLLPMVENSRDNLRLQKLFSDICIELGKKEEALETLKYLLFVNPRNKEVSDLVSRIEKEVEEKYKPHHNPIMIPERVFMDEPQKNIQLFNINNLTPDQNLDTNSFDDWMAIDLSQDSSFEKEKTKSIQSTEKIIDTDFDHWNVKKNEQIFFEINDEAEDEVDILKHDFEPSYEKHIQKPAPVENVLEFNDEAPIVTHTLVDLYCGQGHIEKALDVLEKILLLNPNDQKTIKKIIEIKALIQPLEQYSVIEDAEEFELDFTSNTEELGDHNKIEATTEEDGRRNLMSLIDEKIGPMEINVDLVKIEATREITEKLSLFLLKIQKRALDYQGRI